MPDKQKRIEKLKLMQAQKIQTQKTQTIKPLSLTIKKQRKAVNYSRLKSRMFFAIYYKPTDKSVGFSNILLAKGGEKYKL